jgi:hypothetical protein
MKPPELSADLQAAAITAAIREVIDAAVERIERTIAAAVLGHASQPPTEAGEQEATIISRQKLARRWNCSVSTVIRAEKRGVLKLLTVTNGPTAQAHYRMANVLAIEAGAGRAPASVPRPPGPPRHLLKGKNRAKAPIEPRKAAQRLSERRPNRPRPQLDRAAE